jgi:hypothetical protein
VPLAAERPIQSPHLTSGEPTYPFTPTSNHFLRPGQFWAIPLSDGRYGAGRVTAVPAFGPTDRTGVVVALLDWSGDEPPTSDALAGRAALIQAKSRFETISNTGGAVLGLRPLDLDGIVPMDPLDFRVGTTQKVWGWKTIVRYAEERFAKPSIELPSAQTVAAEIKPDRAR